ncbi:MAG: ATP-binding protein, partial [Balneolaceae bacterium]|nr:ATP-binding protein [Balneolaceae bacterium]
INLVDSYTQWPVSSYGHDFKPAGKADSVCQYTLLESDYLEITSLKSDERFRDLEYVASGPKLDYYCGVPLKTSNGYNIGALCVLDEDERRLPPEKIEMLHVVARQIVTSLELLGDKELIDEMIRDVTEHPAKTAGRIMRPIYRMIQIAQIIEDISTEAGSDTIKRIVTLISSSGAALLDVTEQVASRQTGEANSHPCSKRHTLKELREKVLKLFRTRAESYGITLSVTINRRYDEIPVAGNRLLIVLCNLVSNALHFSERGDSVTLEMGIAADSPDNYSVYTLYVSLQDSAVGMTREEVDKLRKSPFDERNRETVNHAINMGYSFGVQIAQKLLHPLNPDLRIWSARDLGNHIEILIPMGSTRDDY